MTTDQILLSEFSDHMEVLSAAERRDLLFALQEINPDDDILAQLNKGSPASDGVAFQTMMQHAHLPKLEAYGLIDWNQETNAVRRGPAFEEIEPLLDVLASHQDELHLEVDSS